MKSASMPANFGVGQVLRGKTLGVWGYGKIGQLVAGYGKAFGMRVQVWGSPESRARAGRRRPGRGAQPRGAVHRERHRQPAPAPERRDFGIVRLEDLNRMKPTSLLVNTSRAELIEPEALIAALNRGRPGMAAIDVFESEPILQGHALLRLENCICTPHIGYVEQESYELYFGAAFDNVVSFIKGTPDQHRQPGGAAGPPLMRHDARRRTDDPWANPSFVMMRSEVIRRPPR
jgi:D-3-phosphoglycerate dehydrogenase